ncbi:hypothetical protein ACVME8_000084 [Bradyrhizobium diazoefficiens]
MSSLGATSVACHDFSKRYFSKRYASRAIVDSKEKILKMPLSVVVFPDAVRQVF